MAGRNYPLLLGAGVAVLLSGMVGAAALTGVLPVSAKAQESSARGVVSAVRRVEGAGPPYRITVRMDDGSERIVTSASAPPYAVGVRVKVNGNALERG